MDWSLKAVLVFAGVFGVLAADHYLLGGWLQATLAALAETVAGAVP